MRTVDAAGNVTYVCSARLTVDTVPPQISGFENGSTHYGDLSFTVTDALDCTVTVDGNPAVKADGTYTVAADNAIHTITATDAAGNTVSYTVTIYGIYTVTLPTVQTGYTLTAESLTVRYGEPLTLTFVLNNGYSVTDQFAIKVNGIRLALIPPNLYRLASVTEPVTITVEGVADVQGPDVSVQIGTNRFDTLQTEFSECYYNNAATVTVTAADAGTGVHQIEYLFSAIPIGKDDLDDMTWTAYASPFSLDINTPSILYVRAVDTAGNVTYVCSARLIKDTTPPQIIGFTHEGTHYGDLAFSVSDAQSCTVTVDGNPITKTGETYTVTADNATHIVTVTDAAGNVVSYSVTLYRVYTVTFMADGATVATRTVNHGAALTDIPAIPVKNGYTVISPVWDMTDFSTVTSDLTVYALYTQDPTPAAPDDTNSEGSATDTQTQTDTENTPDTDKTTPPIVIIAIALGGCVAVGGIVCLPLLKKKKR